MGIPKMTTEYRLNYWAEILQERMARGQSISTYCEAKGIGKSTYYYWQRRIKELASQEISSADKQKEVTEPKITNRTNKDKREGSDAERGLMYVNALFELERKWKALSPEERYHNRLKESKPIADAYFAWVENLGALPKSPLGEAAHYTLSQRKYLENVFTDGRAELSNNRCERSVKPFVQGRKAWLFSNTPGGAAASSVMYSMIETAKENGLHPFYCMKFLLETLPKTTTDNLESLLPWSPTLPVECRVPVKIASGSKG